MIKSLTRTFNSCRRFLARVFKRAAYGRYSGAVGLLARPFYNPGAFAIEKATTSTKAKIFYSTLLVIPLGWWALGAIFLPQYLYKHAYKGNPPPVCKQKRARYNSFRTYVKNKKAAEAAAAAGQNAAGQTPTAPAPAKPAGVSV